MDIQITGQEKVFAVYISDQGIASKMYKEPLKIKNRNPIKNYKKT